MTLPLEQQVINLELAKKMKELGFEQESLWYWCMTGDFKTYNLCNKSFQLVHGTRNYFNEKGIDWCSAYTVAELGEMLPECVGSWKYNGGKGGFHCGECLQERMDKYLDQSADTEANARAKMLIYLKEQGLLCTQQNI